MNPYQGPAVDSGGTCPSGARRNGILATPIRKLAICIFALPFIAFVPYHYWVFNHAGGWYLSYEMEPDERAARLSGMFILDVAALCSVTWFLGLLFLCIDGYRPWVTGCLLIPATLAALPGMARLVLFICVYVFFGFL